MKSMNRRTTLLAIVAAAAIASGAFAQELSTVRNVYLLPMGSGLDQYIANHLTNSDAFQVVTDPDRADAIITEQIGPGFEERLEELYPPPPPEETDSESSDDAAALIVQDTGRPTTSSFSRGKGNVFLVGRESRQVIWSTYNLPKNSSSKQLNTTARHIVNQLLQALGR